MAPRSIGERISAVLPDLYALRSFEAFPRAAVSLVRLVIGGEKGEYTEVDLHLGAFRVVVHPEPAVLHELVEERRAYMHEHPVLRHALRRHDSEPRLISEFVSAREWRRSGLYCEFFRHLGVEDQVTVLVSSPSARVRAGISVDRASRTFSLDERRLLAALQPHLVVARRNAIHFSRALGGGLADEETSTVDRLTDRQRQVLAGIADGLTNDQIARHLEISPGTARKHVEHVLKRLEVSTRTAAATHHLKSAAGLPPWTAAIHGLAAVP